MRRLVSLLVVCFSLFLLSSCGSSPANTEESAPTGGGNGDQGHEIKVKVDGFSGSEIFMAYYFGKQQYASDTAQIGEDGYAVFKGDKMLPKGLYTVLLPPENKYFELMLNDIDQDFTVETNADNFLENMKITGSKENQVFYEYLGFYSDKNSYIRDLQEMKKTSTTPDKVQADIDKVADEIKDYRTKLQKKHPNFFYSKVLALMEEPDYPKIKGKTRQDTLNAFYKYKSIFLDNVDFSDTSLLRTPFLYQKIDKYLTKMTEQVADSVIPVVDMIVNKSRANDEVFKYVVVTLVNEYDRPKVLGLDAVFVHLIKSVYEKGDAFWAEEGKVKDLVDRANNMSNVLQGKVIPDITLPALEGGQLSLHEVESQFTIFYIWDYDCEHCKVVTPRLARMYQKYQNKNVKLVAMNVKGKGEMSLMKETIAKYGLGGIHIYDFNHTSGFHKKYDVRSTPRIFFLNKNKKILGKPTSVNQLEQMMLHFLGN